MSTSVIVRALGALALAAAPLVAQERMSAEEFRRLTAEIKAPQSELPAPCDLPRVARPTRMPLRESVPFDDRGGTCALRSGFEFLPIRTMYRIDLPKRTSVELQVSSTDFGPGVSLHDTAGRQILAEVEGDPFHGPVDRKDTRTLRASLPAGTYFAIVRDDHRVSAMQDKRRKQVTVDWREAAGPLGAGATNLCATPSHDPVSTLVPDGRLTGTLDDGDCEDRDYYYRRRDVHEIRVPSSRRLFIRATGTGYLPAVRLYDLNDSLRAPLSPPTVPELGSDKAGRRYALSAGRYFLVVLPEVREDNSTRQGAYEVTVVTEGAALPDSSTYGAICQGPQLLRVPQQIGAVLTRESCRAPDGGPQHAYVLDVPVEQQVEVRAWRAGGVAVPVVRLSDAKGAEVGMAQAGQPQSGGRSDEASLTRRLAAGRYLIRVAAQPGGFGTVITRVSGEAKPCRLPADTAAGIAVGRAHAGAITSATCLLPGNTVPVAVHPLVVTQAEELRFAVEAQGFAATLTVQRMGGRSEPPTPGDTRTSRTVTVQPGTYWVGIVSADRLPGAYRLCVSRGGGGCTAP